MMIRIVTDSTCDIPAPLLQAHRIAVVPVNVLFGQISYAEGETLSRDEFYQKVAAASAFPTTSGPSLGQYEAAYTRVADEEGTEAILSIHLTGELSGTYESAVTAAGQTAARVPVTTFDSCSGSMGLGFMVLEAAAMAEAGCTLEAILDRLAALRDRMQIFFSVDDLQYARMSGRVGMAQALLASLLQIKPLIGVEQGRLVMLRRVRNRAQALRSLVDTAIAALGEGPVRMAVIHAQAPQVAAELASELRQRMHLEEIITGELSIGLAAHLGPGTVGVVGYNL